MAATRQAIEKALESCRDPELGIDVINLGLIYDVSISPKKITITMTLTTPGCPLVPYFRDEIVRVTQSVAGPVPVDIQLTFDPPWKPDRMSGLAKKQLLIQRS